MKKLEAFKATELSNEQMMQIEGGGIGRTCSARCFDGRTISIFNCVGECDGTEDGVTCWPSGESVSCHEARAIFNLEPLCPIM